MITLTNARTKQTTQASAKEKILSSTAKTTLIQRFRS